MVTNSLPDKNSYIGLQIVSIMIAFFVMGSIEMVGIASNYIKVTLHLTDAKANFLPSLVYIWFIIITIPAGILMHKIGRERTVVLSMSVMALSMVLPIFGSSYYLMILCFAILGMSNVSMQTSLYPLLSNIISGKKLADKLTMGQFIKTLSSFSAPYIAMLGSLYFIKTTGLGWRILFVFYLIMTLFTIIFMSLSKFDKKPDLEKTATYGECFKLLKAPFVMLAFIGVMCHVGIDISTNTVAPKILMNRLGMNLEDASFGASLYFISRLAGCLFWTLFLRKVANRSFFFISIFLIFSALVGLYFADTKLTIYICIVMIGFGNANLFPVFFSQAVQNVPQNKDTISVLMIMGQAGGAFFPYTMGIVFDRVGLNGSLSVLMIGVLYLIFYCFHLKRNPVTQ